MSSTLTLVVTGHSVGVSRREYGTWRARDGREMPGGVSVTFHLWDAGAAEVRSIKVKEHTDAFASLQFGTPVRVVCSVRAADRGMTLTAASLPEVLKG